MLTFIDKCMKTKISKHKVAKKKQPKPSPIKGIYFLPKEQIHLWVRDHNVPPIYYRSPKYSAQVFTCFQYIFYVKDAVSWTFKWRNGLNYFVSEQEKKEKRKIQKWTRVDRKWRIPGPEMLCKLTSPLLLSFNQIMPSTNVWEEIIAKWIPSCKS